MSTLFLIAIKMAFQNTPNSKKQSVTNTNTVDSLHSALFFFLRLFYFKMPVLSEDEILPLRGIVYRWESISPPLFPGEQPHGLSSLFLCG